MLNQELIEREYPQRDKIAYLNTSAIALPPVSLRRAVKCYIDTLSDSFCHNAAIYHDQILEEGRKAIAGLLSCSPEQIAFTRNTCDGITQFAQAFPFAAGDNVVVSAQEYPSNLYPWLSLERKGVEIRVIDSEKNGKLLPEKLIAASDQKTKAVSVAGTFFCNGYRIDMKRLSKLCHERGILLVADTIQELGRMEVLPEELGIDFLSNGGHKCLLGLKGTGFLYCSRELLPMLIPFTACHQSIKTWHRPPLERHYNELIWKQNAGRFESGNPNFVGICAMTEGVNLINCLGIQSIEDHILRLEEQLLEQLERAGLHPIHHEKKMERSGIVFLYLPEGADEKELDALLISNQIYATVREGYVRISIHFYNTEEHMARVVRTLKQFLGNY